jgi:uncharacterized OB-fold protein
VNPNIPLQPHPTPDTAPYWEATARGKLELCWCDVCERYMHPPLELCRSCGGATTFRPVSGRGVIFSYIVVHRGVVPGYLDRPGHVIALVELDEQEGLRLSTQLLDVDPADVRIGMPVEARVVALPGGDLRIPTFQPAAPSV